MAGPNEFSLRSESDTLSRARFIITPVKIDKFWVTYFGSP